MKKKITYLIVLITPLFFACRGPVEENTSAASTSVSSENGANYNYSIDTRESVVSWKGAMQMGNNSHLGYVSISKGAFYVENNQLLSGTAEVDMNTIADEKHDGNNDLIKHLKDPDFFDVEKFPTSTIAITSVETINGDNKTITGSLTIKGIRQTVSFPAKVEVQNRLIKINGKLTIDRTKWGVIYKSGKFFDLLADQIMSDFIEFDVSIVAKEKRA